MSKPVINIVADIGGTNLRIASLDSEGKCQYIQTYQCKEHPSLRSVIEDYLKKSEIDSSKSLVNACLAIACPVDQDLIHMTNLPWSFSKAKLKNDLGLHALHMINDYTAMAWSINELDEWQKVKIGGGEPVQHKPIGICGPGTGLGVANLIWGNGQWISVDGEGGHTDFAPTNDQEVAILSYLREKYSRVSYEQVLSGLGIEQIYQALCHVSDVETNNYSAADISKRAIDKSCDICLEAMLQFCKTLGSFAGNMALHTSAFGGIYIAGGIVPRFLEFFEESGFRRRFEAKGRFTHFNAKIPTYVITESQPGLLGASAYLTQQNINEGLCR
ncbi:glucokinase [Thalassotalea crassostreae]|uniref:glucokinase n=1 Tax=Thalassotalea crassostreae TaxID=1763536 RepID=UPI00083906FE|nr:glucokinase [Thalassotalea crassostreae]